MKSFEYAAPATLKQALGLLGERWGQTEVLAGGTDLVTSLKQQLIAPRRVVSLKNIKELKGIRSRRSGLTIGAMTTLAELIDHEAVAKHFPSMITAARGIGSPQVLNAGTVGGDLCQRPRCWYYRNGHGLFGRSGDSAHIREGENRYHAIFGNDGPALFVSPSSLGPALVALDATMTLAGPGANKRKLSAIEFFHTPKIATERETALQPNEILVEIFVPTRGLKNATYEVRHRHGLDWPYVTASVAFALKGGVARNPRVVLGHVAPTPWLSASASSALEQVPLSEAAAASCGEAAVQGARPLSGNEYKIQMAKAAVKRAVMATALA